MIFRLTKKKVIASIIIGLIIYILLLFYTSLFRNICMSGGFDNCIDYAKFSPFFLMSRCGCENLKNVLIEWIIFLVPFIIPYIIISFFQKKE